MHIMLPLVGIPAKVDTYFQRPGHLCHREIVTYGLYFSLLNRHNIGNAPARD